MKKLLLPLFLVTMFTLNANALFLEPYVGFQKGTYATATEALTHDGVVLGGRVGTDIAVLFFAGLDVMTVMSGTAEGTTNSGDFSRTAIGAVFGVDLPLVKAYVGYNFQDNFSIKDSAGTTTDFEGVSTKIGVGVSVFPLTSVNLEYINNDVSEASSGSTTVTSGLDSNLGTYLISVSISI
jgi:hypothetical protein